MPLGGNYFAHGSFPEEGQKQKTEKKKKERERKRERKLVITMAKLRMAHGSTHGARKPPGPKPGFWVLGKRERKKNKSESQSSVTFAKGWCT